MGGVGEPPQSIGSLGLGYRAVEGPTGEVQAAQNKGAGEKGTHQGLSGACLSWGEGGRSGQP